MSTTVTFLDTAYPVIAELTNGYHLVAHPNGPAICNGDHISTIDIYANGEDEPEMAALKHKAIRLYREWSWPKLVHEFYPPESTP